MEHAFPPFALATASSEASFSGCDQPNGAEHTGSVEQSIPVGCGELRTISVWLANRNPHSVTAAARVFGSDGRMLREMREAIPPGERQSIDFHVDLSPLSGAKIGQFLRFQLDLPEGAAWLGATPDPAIPSKCCFRLSPPQPCFWPANVLPETPDSNRFTGVWKSDPKKPFPHRLEISWKDPLDLHGIELEFPNPPETPTHYRIEVFAHGQLSESVEVAENSLSSQTHRFDAPIPADHLRLTVFTSRSAPSVSVSRVMPVFRNKKQE